MKTYHTVRRWWPLAVIFIVSLGLRWFHLGNQSLFSDEGVSWIVARLSPSDIMGMSAFNHHTPLYFFLLKLALIVLPSTEVGVRTLSVVASAAALIAVLAFLKVEWSLAAAVYAGILMALSSFDVYYAQEARMYTLLAAAWIISYIALVKAMQGKPRWLVAWAIGMIAMPWTHLYGFLVVGANIAFVVGYLIVKRLYRFVSPVADRWLLLAMAVIAVGISPMVRILVQHADTNSVAGAIPQLNDLRDLFLLWTAGLVATRQSFTDAAHLTLLATANWSPTIWLAVGMVICGVPAVYGLAQALRMTGTRRVQAVLAIVNILLPVAIAFGYATIMGTRIWIQRPFLGAAYLIYLWAGIGLAHIPFRKSRWALAVLAVVVTLASLVPYYSVWQKSDGRQAFRSMPPPDKTNALVLEMPFLASQARFYLGPDASLLVISATKDGMPSLAKLRFDQGRSFARIMGRQRAITCDELATVTDLWLFGNGQPFRLAFPQLPGCITEKRLWLFENGRWTQLDPLARNSIDDAGAAISVPIGSVES